MLRFAVIFYTIASMLFLYYSNIDSRYVRGGDKILNYIFIIILSGYLIKCKNLSAITKHWLLWVIGFEFVRSIYTSICISAPLEWVYVATNIYIITIATIFCIFVAITLYTKKKL